MKVLLVEDHDDLRRMTATYLSERGFVVDAVASLDAAREALCTASYDAMVLDIGLPDGDGSLLLSDRSIVSRPPALILTARDGVEDRITVLNAGADDYLVKPFELGELEARLRAVLRRPGRRTPIVLTLGRVRFETTSRQTFVADRPLDLGRREALLLETLLSAAGRIVVRDHLCERLYGFDEPVTPNALEAVVSRLRRVLDLADAGVTLETRRGIGYGLRESPQR